MTRQEAADLINKKYPKAKAEEKNIDLDDEGITLWSKGGDKDFFDFEGKWIGHKEY
jgi:hypothetical protein